MAALSVEAAGGSRRQLVTAGFFVIAGIVVGTLGEPAQQRIAGAVRGSVLRPFLAMQEIVAATRVRAGSADELMERVDSLSAIVSSQSVLVQENETLRRLLDLSERLGPRYRSATVLRPGTPGSESMFLLDVGTEEGVRAGAPVISPDGLVGVVREAGPSSAVGMDWTHPDFRASAMVAEAELYGIVENRRGDFREEDRLVLTGTAYNEVLEDGSLVLTSGLGGVYPRGIPIGVVDGVADFQGTWRKSYWLRPMVRPAAVTHVLVPVGPEDGEGEGIPWPLPTPPGEAPEGAAEDGSGAATGGATDPTASVTEGASAEPRAASTGSGGGRR